MPKRRSLRDSRSPQRLLRILTDNPALPRFVPTLPAPVLKRLIGHVGLRDAGELIRLTTVDQMRELFEVALWETLVPGQAERLRPERFLEWLDVMLEVSPAFAAERLVELGDTFVVMNFAPLITVIERSVLAEHHEGSCACVQCRLDARGVPYEMIDDWIVSGVHEDEWDTLRTLLVELEEADAAFLDRVLARCSSAPTMRAFAPDGQELLNDETWARAARRERGGFVTPDVAAVFLETARRTACGDLVGEEAYDAISRRHFDQLATAMAVRTASETLEASGADAAPDSHAAPTESPSLIRARLRELESALVDAAIIGDHRPELLTGPQQTREPELELQARLDRLMLVRPEAFAARLTELVFLANVLMAGSWYQGRRFTESEAATAALACANLGMDHLLRERGQASPRERAAAIDGLLEDRPGLVRFFRIGWNLIQALPVRSAEALIGALRADHVRAELARKRWMLDEIEWGLSHPDIFELIEQGEFADVGDNLVLLGLVLDERACQCLRTLICDIPRYPLQLNIGFRAGTPAGIRSAGTNESRFLSTLDQLARVDAFLGEIDTLLKI